MASALTYIVRIVYAPDPLSDDRISIGVVALSERGTTWEMLSDWRRAAQFGREPVGYVREWLGDFESRLRGKSLMVSVRETDLSYFKRIASESALAGIQVVAPQPVFLEHDVALQLFADRYLHLDRVGTQDSRPRRKAHLIKTAHSVLDGAMLRVFDRHDIVRYVREDLRIDGLHGRHELDLGVGNGRVYLGAYAMSFARSVKANIQMETESIYWSLSDIRSPHPTIPLSVLIDPPIATSDSRDVGLRLLFDEFQDTCRKLSANIVYSTDIEAWAEQSARELVRSGLSENLPR